MDGRQRISEITNGEIMAYVAKDRATCTNATVNRRLQMLGRALRHMGKIYKADIPDIELKTAQTKEPKERIRELSQPEQARMFEALTAEYVPFVAFALMTGARIESIASLRWSDIHLDRGEMIFHLKGDDVMTFPVNPEIRALLSALPRSELAEYQDRVFVTLNRQTQQLTPIISSGGVFGTAWRKALADADVHNFRFHDLRHTYATRFLRMTNNLKLVSEMLGHKDIATTMRYAHVMMDDKRTAMQQFSIFAGAEKGTTPSIAPRMINNTYKKQ
jgi:integrase